MNMFIIDTLEFSFPKKLFLLCAFLKKPWNVVKGGGLSLAQRSQQVGLFPVLLGKEESWV